MDLGHLESPDLTVTIDYVTAKATSSRANLGGHAGLWPGSRSRAT